MSYYLKSGHTFRVSSKEAMDLYDTLPAGNYVIKKDPFDNLYLETIDSFEFKGKQYGDNIRNTERILKTFLDRSSSTGVMLAGEKGSGKSLLAKSLAMRGAELGIPTIVINAPWQGDKFNAFIQTIEQPCIVLMDEFEKVYDKDEQEGILTLLDGVFPSKKLFILTCNDKWRVDSHMRNRPGRIFYMIEFSGLDVEFIREYCEDNLNNKEYIDQVCNISKIFTEFSFDSLKGLVEEMNRYNETPQQALSLLNIKPEFSGSAIYSVRLIINEKEISQNMIENAEWSGNPLQETLYIEYKSKDKDGDVNWHTVKFSQKDIKSVDSNTGKLMFTDSNNNTLLLCRQNTSRFNIFNAF